MATLAFLGAVDTVTGSRYLVDTGGARVLVDCGLFQGLKKLRERNWSPPPFDPGSLAAIVLTHAHIDHTGYLPRLVKAGFTGRVYCTSGTRDLLHLLLPDAGFLQEEEAKFANRGGYSKHHPALPLYTRDEAEACLDQLVTRDFHREFEVAPGVTARFSRAGHIVGSACVQLTAGDATIAFSGDVGRPGDPIMKAPEPMPAADTLVVESTYGDRLHPSDDVRDVLARTIVETIERRGVVVVPSFAVGRTQHLLHLLCELRDAHRIPECPIFLDSPMAIDATELYLAHREDHGLTDAECAAMGKLPSYSRTADDSKAIDRRDDPMIIISASGMATGGRVLHHLRRFLPDERSTVLFVGYQAAGTRGRTLIDGARELKLLGQYVAVHAHVAAIDGLSAHADYAELLAWLRASNLAPRRVFVTHGEPAAADAFRRRVRDVLGWDARLPEVGEIVTI